MRMGGKERERHLAVSGRIWNLGFILLYPPLYSRVSLGKRVNLSKMEGLSFMKLGENGDEE